MKKAAVNAFRTYQKAYIKPGNRFGYMNIRDGSKTDAGILVGLTGPK